MKECSRSRLEGTKKKVVVGSPPWLLAPVFSLYSWLHPLKQGFLAIPLSSAYLVVTGGSRILVPLGRANVPGDFAEVCSEYWDRHFCVERGDVVLDVGAWVGDFTIPAAKRAGRGGKVIAVEPHPGNLSFLKYNLEHNVKLENVKVIEKALWRRKGRMKLFLGQGFSSSEHSLRAGEGEQLSEASTYVWVETETLDGLVSRLGLERVDFLKMDVEGAELDVLSRGKRTLEITRKVAVAAYHLREGRQTWPEVERILRKHGFETQVTERRIVRGWLAR